METFYLNHETQAIACLTIAAECGELSPGSLLLLLTDATSRARKVVAIDDVPEDPPQDERQRALRTFVPMLRDDEPCEGMLLAVAREGHPKPRGGDLGWHDAFADAAAAAGVDCHGTYVVTPAGVRKVRPYLTPQAA